jgi:hypothetical protein
MDGAAMSYWRPDTQAPQRPTADELRRYASDEADANERAAILYLKSYLVMRAAIGFLGIALPIGLFLGDALWLKGTMEARGSLSAYYHSGMRDLFVGTLFATGVFLVTYRVVEHTLDNILSIIAGIAVMGVALFPTSRPPGSGSPLTPLEARLGEQRVAIVHYVCAGIFIVLLGVISLIFGVREGKRSQRRDGGRARRSPTFWRRFHWGCAAAIGLALAFMGVSEITRWFSHYSLIVGETVAVFAFGVSWLMKGLELQILLGRPAAGLQSPAPVPVEASP